MIMIAYCAYFAYCLAYFAYWSHQDVFDLNYLLDILFDVLNLFIYILLYIFCILDLVTYYYISCIFSSSYCAYYSTYLLIYFCILNQWHTVHILHIYQHIIIHIILHIVNTVIFCILWHIILHIILHFKLQIMHMVHFVCCAYWRYLFTYCIYVSQSKGLTQRVSLGHSLGLCRAIHIMNNVVAYCVYYYKYFVTYFAYWINDTLCMFHIFMGISSYIFLCILCIL